MLYNIRNYFFHKLVLTFLILLNFTASNIVIAEDTIDILNVSYDPTREYFVEYNKLFKGYWEAKHSQIVNINQSHGGSGKQARSVIDGLEADVVTLALSYDIDQIANAGIISRGWKQKLPNNSVPFYSTIVFLVRKGNPKNIQDWNDLARDGIEVITPNPKTSGGARWNYLAAWGYALRYYNNDEEKVFNFIKKIIRNIPILDTGARAASVSFTQRELGDVLITWENEAYLALKEFGSENFQIVMPSISIIAEPPVAVVDKYASNHGTLQVATKYLKYLYSDKAQELAVKHYFRPSSKHIANKFKDKIANIELFTLESIFNNWQEAQLKHFDDGGTFDRAYLGE